jgi:ABC-type sugar transport system permease subunit
MFSGLFKLFLYLPSIVSGIVLMFVYRHIINRLLPQFINNTFYDGERVVPALLDKHPFGSLLFFSIYMGLGGHILMYTGTMSGIDDSIVEAAQLDGVNAFQEFWYITLPLIYPTFVTFFVTGLASIFVNDLGAFTFFGDTLPFSLKVHTIGFLIFASTKKGSTIDNAASDVISLNQVATMGLMITAITLPTTLLVKKYMTKWGPSTT